MDRQRVERLQRGMLRRVWTGMRRFPVEVPKMRTTVTLSLAVLAAATSLAQAGEREEALALVQRAIRAHGGASALTSAQAMVRKGSGVLMVNDQEVPFA